MDVVAKQVLADVQGLALANRVRLDPHCIVRMAQRNVSRADLMHALVHGADCVRSSDGADRWKVTGPDRDGDDLTAVVMIESGVLVITVF